MSENNDSAAMITPQAAFIQWFNSQPRNVAEILARLFYICTTENTNQMAQDTGTYWSNFKYLLVKSDFPLRIAARMFYIRAIFDMVIFHHEQLIVGNRMLSHGSGEGTELALLSGKQWERVLDSWTELRGQEMSENYIHSWAAWMIKQQREA